MPDLDARALIAAGETYTVEFKSDRPHLSDSELVEAAVCLANGEGGVLLLGVEDDGRVTGLSFAPGTVDPVRMQALLMNRTLPALSCQVEIRLVDGREVALIMVPKSPGPVGTQSGTYKRRAIRLDGRPECVPYSLADMMSRVVSVGAQDYALLPVHGLAWEDLDRTQFDVFRRLAAAGGDTVLAELSDLEIARALRLVSPTASSPTPLMGALLLFGRESALRRFAPTHEVLFQVADHTDLSLNDDVTAGLFGAAQAVFARFQARNSYQEVATGLVHLRVPKIPERAFREAIANALVHRDYARMGPVRVMIDQAGVTITNPGGFVEGVGVANILEQSRPRSPVLAEAFKRAGLVERSGLGVRRMFEDVVRLGRIAPDYSRSDSSSVSVRFDTANADLALARFFFQVEQRLGQPLALTDLLVLADLRREGQITVAKAASLAQLPTSQARAGLVRLVELGLVESRAARPGGTYHLSSGSVRELGRPSAVGGVDGTDRARAWDMILQYVRAAGSINRSQAAGLCGLAPTQATTVLRSMVASGALELRGSRRGSHYVVAGGPDSPAG
jgi:ATP-dependent DNA helicase RecG